MKKEFVIIKTWHTEEDEPILISDHASQEAMDQAGNDYFEKTGDRNVSVLAMYGSDSKEEIMDIENLGQDELVRAKEWKGKNINTNLKLSCLGADGREKVRYKAQKFMAMRLTFS